MTNAITGVLARNRLSAVGVARVGLAKTQYLYL